MSLATTGFGVLIKRGDGASPEVFTAVAEVVSDPQPTLQRSSHEVTHHESPDQFREFIVGLKTMNELSVDVNLIPGNSTHDEVTGLELDWKNGTLNNYQITYGAKTINCSMYVTQFQKTLPLDGPKRASVTFRPTGAAWTA